MRLKKLSIFSKSSTKISRVAAVFFAACQTWNYHRTFRGMTKLTHHEKDSNTRKDDCSRGGHLPVKVKVRALTQISGDAN